jgi:hypothetical protein
MASASSPYEIGRATRVCSVSGRELVAGERGVVALVDKDPNEPFERLDLSEEAWATMDRPAGLFAYWRHVVPEREARGPLLDTASMGEVFDQLEEAKSPKQLALRYLLALVLMRKKMLVPVGTTDGDSLVLRRRGDDPEDPPVEVSVPALDPDVLGEVTMQLEALMQAGEEEGGSG